MRPILMEYPFEIASGVSVCVVGLWLKYAPDRAWFWGIIEVWARANRYACQERTRIRALGVDSAGERHAVDCVGRRER